MKKYDSHVHIGDYDITNNLLNNSKYKDKYRLYSAIDPEVIRQQDEYVRELEDFFVIPLFLKESEIMDCNKFVLNYCSNNKGVPVLLVDNNKNFIDDYKIPFFKEHFLLHSNRDYKERSLYYNYLNDNKGYLLLHCKDDIRNEYVSKLLDEYNNISIIVAHLGRDVYENSQFIKNGLLMFKNDERVLFDISTINNLKNIDLALNIIGSERLLYGTDFPFECHNLEDIKNKRCQLIDYIPSDDVENIFEKNFERVRKRVYERK